MTDRRWDVLEGPLRNNAKQLHVEEEQTNIMFDPSMLISKRSLRQVFDIVKVRRDFNLKLYMPSSFVQALHEENFYKNPILQFFLYNAEQASHEEILHFLDYSATRVSTYKIHPEHYEKHLIIRNNLGQYFKFNNKNYQSLLINTLYEEWFFLQEYSFITSRLRKTFNAFIRAGATAVEVSRQKIDKHIREKLNIEEDDHISKKQYMRMFGKWTAVGGTTAWLIFEPVTGGVASGLTNFFLMFDP